MAEIYPHVATRIVLALYVYSYMHPFSSYIAVPGRLKVYLRKLPI